MIPVDLLYLYFSFMGRILSGEIHLILFAETRRAPCYLDRQLWIRRKCKQALSATKSTDNDGSRRIYIRITASQSYPIQFVVNGTLSADGGGDFSEYASEFLTFKQ